MRAPALWAILGFQIMNSSKKILILGVNGFIGSSLAWKILKKTNWTVVGADLASNKIQNCLGRERFEFHKKDIVKDSEWVEGQIAACDTVVPLVAIATPALYVKDPLRVYGLDYEANADIVKKCAKHGKRIVFPSTSEVYGMCPDERFDECKSPLVLGPIAEERWIYSCIKQMLDRVIWAYGKHEGLKFTLFRPFNFIGPKLDDISSPKEGSSRVLTQFAHNIMNQKPVMLVDGGAQKRSFTFIDDGVECILKILENKGGCADGKIFNIGNPDMEFSIRELAEMLVELFGEYPEYAEAAKKAVLKDIPAREYYGEGYADVARRVPSIKAAEEILGWKPKTDLRTALKLTLDYHILKKDYELLG